MNNDDNLQKYDNPEFWGKVIKEAKKQATPIKVIHHYRPVGFLVVISFLVLLSLLDHNIPIPIAILLTMLVALLTLMFS